MPNNERSLILASASPRRRELLEKIGLQFKVEASDYHEEWRAGSRPEEMVVEIAEGKARAVAARYPEAVIIAADTIGVIGRQVIGKPHTAAEAVSMLKKLSGKSHRVITGLTVLDARSGKMISSWVETRVYFRRLSVSEITNYVATGEPLDKAGAYAIQGLGSLLVEKIHGDYYNVVGLPLLALTRILKEFGFRFL
ncbi:MAG TPA: Maf family protein [Dehalococcoidales bacterium]|nr:Maf family protein [Dehalococcoidales bacterium]